MELKIYFNILKKRWLLITLITLLCTVGSALVSFYYLTPLYKADISVLIDDGNIDENISKQSYNSILMYQNLVQTYSQFAKSKAVASDVIRELNLDFSEDQIISMVSTAVKNDTQFLTLSVTSYDNEEAAKIANQLARSLKKVTNEIKKVDNVLLVDDAIVPPTPYTPNKKLNILIGFFIGFMFSVGLAFLLDYLDNTVKNEDEISALLEVPVVGVIPLYSERKKGKTYVEKKKKLAFR